MKMRIIALFAGLLAVLPMTSAWAFDTTYYASLKTVVSSGSTGMGKVYATTTDAVSDYSKFSDTSSQMDSLGSSSGKSASVALWAHALANDGFAFSHWSKTDNGTSASTDNPYSCSQSSSQKNQNTAKNNPTVVYAVFKEVEMATPYAITFQKPESGSYTYSGTVGYSGDKGTIGATTVSAADAEISGLRWMANLRLTASPAAEMKILGWYTIDANGVKQPYFSDKEETDYKVMSATRIGVDFAPDCVAMRAGATTGTSVYKDASVDLATMVADAAADTTGKGLVIFKDVALADDLEIPFDVSITVQPGATLTIAAGKTLVAKGKLINNGKISGGSIVHSYITVVQGKTVRVPWGDGTDGPEGTKAGRLLVDGTSGKYLVTSLKSEDSLSGSGTYDGDKSKQFVTIDNQASGEKFASKISTAKPKAVLCTVAREKAANWINGIVELGATVKQGDDTSKEVYTTFGHALEACGYAALGGSANTDYTDSNKMIVLLQDVTDGYKAWADGSNSGSASKMNAALPKGAVDCAGKSLTITSGGDKINGNGLVKCFNGAVTVSKKMLTQAMSFYNCSGSITICGSSYVAGYCFYDSPVTVSYESKYYPSSSSADGVLNFYAGDYYAAPYATDLYTSTKSTYAVVYSGTYKNDPSKNVYNSNKVEARQDPSTKNWTIFKLGGASGSQVEVNGVECSLAQALENASDSGVTEIKVKQDIEVTEDLVIGTDKDIQLNTSGWTIAGSAKIINNGNLEIIDLSGNIGDERSKVEVPIENSGTLLLSEAIYNGSITLKGGKCYFIDGQFNGDIIVADAVADVRAVAEVGGGSYAKTTYAHAGVNGNLKDLCLDRGYVIGSTPNYLIANIPSSVVSYDRTKSAFTLRAFDASNKAVFAKRENRSACTKEEWILARRLLSSVEMFGKWSVDCAVVFDRDMPEAGFSVTPAIFPMPLDSDVAVAANVDYSAFLQAQRRQGYAPFRYESFLPGGEHETDFDMTLACKSENKGTSCGFEMRLADGVSTTSGLKDYSYKTWVVIGTCRFVFGAGTNRAMLQPAAGEATFFTTLDAAVSSPETNGKAIKLCNDSDEDVTVGKTCVIDTNGFKFDGELVPAGGAEMTVADGVYTFTARPVVARIGDDKYASLAEAVAAANAKGGNVTITLVADVDENVCLNHGVSIATAGWKCAGTVSAAEGCRVDLASGVYTCTRTEVAKVGSAYYVTLAAAVEAASADAEIVLIGNCDECVTVGKVCTIDESETAFSGAVAAADGYSVGKSGKKWIVTAAKPTTAITVAVLEDPANPSEEKQVEIVVDEATVARLEEQKVDVTTIRIEEKKSDGKDVATVEVDGERVEATVSDGLVSVQIVDSKAKPVADLTETMNGKNFEAAVAEQNTGVYQQTKVVEVKGEKIQVIDEDKTPVSVIREKSVEETVMLSVPGTKDRNGNAITFENMFLTPPEDGDQIKLSDAKGDFRYWKFGNGKWNPFGSTNDKENDGTYELTPGMAFWYTKATPGRPVSVVAAYEEVKTPILAVPTQEDATEKWNMIVNVNANEAVDLNDIVDVQKPDEVRNDTVIVPVEGGLQRNYTLGKDNKWGYNKSKVVIRNGMKFMVNEWKSDDAAIPRGKGFWYVSGGGKPTIDWYRKGTK